LGIAKIKKSNTGLEGVGENEEGTIHECDRKKLEKKTRSECSPFHRGKDLFAKWARTLGTLVRTGARGPPSLIKVWHLRGNKFWGGQYDSDSLSVQ